MLTTDVLTSSMTSVNDAATVLGSLYTGATRAQYELIIPGYLRDWAVEHQGRWEGA